jgi:hypothetical protein
MFPNLRQVIICALPGNRRVNRLGSPFQFTHATSKLEKIAESDECELTRQLALSNMCDNLKTLNLGFSRVSSLSSSDILSQLKKYASLRQP